MSTIPPGPSPTTQLLKLGGGDIKVPVRAAPKAQGSIVRFLSPGDIIEVKVMDSKAFYRLADDSGFINKHTRNVTWVPVISLATATTDATLVEKTVECTIDSDPLPQVQKLSLEQQTTPAESESKSESESLLPLLGVKFSYFEKFIAENGGRNFFLGKTTAEINSSVLVSLCSKTKISVCDQLRVKESKLIDRPSWFISHAWSYKFLDVVDAVGLTLRRVEGEDKYRDTVVWFDQFTLVHPAPPSLPYDVLHDTFMNSTKQIGRMILVFDKWDNPAHLTRAWCVFEAYACLATSSVLEVAMTQDENDRFLQAVRHDNTTFFQMLTQINTSKSEARYDEDRIKIHRAICEKIPSGFTGLDRTIFSELEKWMISLLNDQIKSSVDETDRADWQLALASVYDKTGKPDLAEPLCNATLTTRQNVLGDEHPSTLSCITFLVGLYRVMRKYDIAESMILDCLAVQKRVLGEDHPDTLKSTNMLAKVYTTRCLYTKAEPIYVACLAAQRRVLGDEHRDTLSSINNLAHVYESQRKYDQAEALYSEDLATCRRILGNEHPETLTSIGALGYYFDRRNKNAEAEALYTEGLHIQLRVLGCDHPITQHVATNLRRFYNKTNQVEKLISVVEEILVNQRQLLGNTHSDTLNNIRDLARLYVKVSKPEPAEALFKEHLSNTRLASGDEHISTLNSMRVLARFYVDQEKLVEAEALFKECLDIERRTRVGTEVDTLINAIKELAQVYMKLEKFQKAETLFKDCLAIQRDIILTQNDTDILYTIQDLTLVYEKLDKFNESEKLISEFPALLRHILSKKSDDQRQYLYIPHISGIISKFLPILEAQDKLDLFETIANEVLTILLGSVDASSTFEDIAGGVSFKIDRANDEIRDIFQILRQLYIENEKFDQLEILSRKQLASLHARLGRVNKNNNHDNHDNADNEDMNKDITGQFDDSSVMRCLREIKDTVQMTTNVYKEKESLNMLAEKWSQEYLDEMRRIAESTTFPRVKDYCLNEIKVVESSANSVVQNAVKSDVLSSSQEVAVDC